MKYFKKLIGDRIYLSPKNVSDETIEKYTEWLNDFQVTDYIGQTTNMITLQSEKEWMENAVKNDKVRTFDIVCLENNKLIGTIGLNGFNWIARRASLGIFIGDREYRNNGYGPEAINLLLEYGFKYLNLHSIGLSLVAINERAHKCYLKCGFKDTGRSRDKLFINGNYYDMLDMDILENEFKGDYIKNKNV